jgi:hypothetical protein
MNHIYVNIHTNKEEEEEIGGVWKDKSKISSKKISKDLIHVYVYHLSLSHIHLLSSVYNDSLSELLGLIFDGRNAQMLH